MKINTDAKPNSGEPYVIGPCVIESDGGRRVLYGLYRSDIDSSDGAVSKVVEAQTDERGIKYLLDPDTDLQLNADSNVAMFISHGVRYRIRPLRDSDKSWVINFESPTES